MAIQKEGYYNSLINEYNNLLFLRNKIEIIDKFIYRILVKTEKDVLQK